MKTEQTYTVIENGKVRHTCGQIGLARLYARRIRDYWLESGFCLGSLKIQRGDRTIVAVGEAVEKVGEL